MKVLLKAFGVFEKEYNAPIKNEKQPLYFVHRTPIKLSSMFGEINLTTAPDELFKKAVFEHNGDYEGNLPIYEFMKLD